VALRAPSQHAAGEVGDVSEAGVSEMTVACAERLPARHTVTIGRSCVAVLNWTQNRSGRVCHQTRRLRDAWCGKRSLGCGQRFRSPIVFAENECFVVAIDPAASSSEDTAETGIILAGKDANGIGHVLGDYPGRYTPPQWAGHAIALYREHKADRRYGVEPSKTRTWLSGKPSVSAAICDITVSRPCPTAAEPARPVPPLAASVAPAIRSSIARPQSSERLP
jgi:hypothetical protein